MEQPKKRYAAVQHNYLFSQDDKIAIGQCFNLAHNEYCARMAVPGGPILDKEWLINRTAELFELKLRAETKIGDKHRIPDNRKEG